MSSGAGKRTTLEDCSHTPLKGGRQISVDPAEVMEITLVLRRRKAVPDPHQAFSDKVPHRRDYLDHAVFTGRYGANLHDVELIHRFAKEFGLEIKDESLARRSMVLSGTATHMAKAFGVEFVRFEHEREQYHATAGAPSIPEEIAGVVEAVFGVHSRPAARRSWNPPERSKDRGRSMIEIAKAYEFPEGTDGSGQCIGLIELGGGFYEKDIKEYCSGLGLKAPHIDVVSVRGARNNPASAKDVRDFIHVANGELEMKKAHGIEAAQCTVEVTMDIEIVAALAPGARIVVYFAPTDEQGIYNALTRAIHDEEHRPSVLSLSWGEPENGVSKTYVRLIDEAMRAAAHLGITVCASSGDAGAMNDSRDAMPAVNFPASSPYCLGCGGTNARFAQDAVAVMEESVWNATHHGIQGATGGGVSRKFPLPAWQHHSDVPKGPTGKKGRGVPDVAGPADPSCGCEMLVAGQSCTSAGTSAVAPLWAALIARCNQALGVRCGYINPLLYQIAAHADGPKALRAVKSGGNGLYRARSGWSACTGLGTPRGKHLLQMMKQDLE